MLKASWLPQGAPGLIWGALAGDWSAWDHDVLGAATSHHISWHHGPWGGHLHVTPHRPGVQPCAGNGTSPPCKAVGGKHWWRTGGCCGQDSCQAQVIPLHWCQVHSKPTALQGEVVKPSAPRNDHSERE